MPYLVVAGQTISVAVDTPARNRVEIGKRERAFDGTQRSSVRARKSEWTVETTWYTRANADTLVTALEGAPPLTVTGDMAGSISAHAANIRTAHAQFAAGEFVKVTFDLLEV